jgi:hypothetical protein
LVQESKREKHHWKWSIDLEADKIMQDTNECMKMNKANVGNSGVRVSHSSVSCKQPKLSLSTKLSRKRNARSVVISSFNRKLILDLVP